MHNTIIISTVIHSAVKKVWNYYTNPEHIIHWNFADPSWHCPFVSNNMTVGGKYSARMEARDESFGFDFEAVYKEIIEGKKFTYEMPNGRQVTVVFDGDDSETNLTVMFEPEEQNSLEMQRNGWQAILNNFKNYTESN